MPSERVAQRIRVILLVSLAGGCGRSGFHAHSSGAGDPDTAKDAIAPDIVSATITSNNPDPSKAEVGDAVNVVFSASEAIQTPTVIIAGGAAALSGGPTTWTASRQLPCGESPGSVTFSIGHIEDLAGNPAADVSASTDGSSVVFDDTPAADRPHDCYFVFVDRGHGQDTHPGTLAEPSRSIKSGIAKAALAGKHLAVCRGTYPEDQLTLDASLSMYGGYDCATWRRLPSYGYPTFDPTNETVIENANVGSSNTTLTISGSAIAATIDGFRIIGDTTAHDGSSAALVIDQATPVVENCRVEGGNGTNAAWHGSVGIVAQNGASPTIRRCWISGGSGSTTFAGVAGSLAMILAVQSADVIENVIEGGAGTCNADFCVGSSALVVVMGTVANVESNTIRGGSGMATGESCNGSVGIFVGDTTRPHIHDNDIHGGSGTESGNDGRGSVGLIAGESANLTSTAGTALEGNRIHGGTGTCDNTGAAYVGVLLTGDAAVEVTGNTIEGGPGTSSTVNCWQSFGLASWTRGTVAITANRVYGGVHVPANSAAGIYGVFVAGASALKVENNMIHGGNKDALNPSSTVLALIIRDTAGAEIRHNTVFSGLAPMNVAAALYIEPDVDGAVVENNIFAGEIGNGASIRLNVCPDATPRPLASVRNNLLINATTYGVYAYGDTPGGACTPFLAISEVDSMESEILVRDAAANVSGNVTLRSDCTGDASCSVEPACDGTDNAACLMSIFAAWDDASNGFEDLWGAGWLLRDGVTCAVSESSLDVGTSVDLLGNARTATPSRGAHELDGACTP